MISPPVYLDNLATTAVDPRVVEAILPFFTHQYGNAGSKTHAFGWAAMEAVDRARSQVASLIGATSKEICFTSGATEANDLAIKGVAQAYGAKGNHIITCVTEHKAVLDPCARLARQGFEVTYLATDSYGVVDLDQLRDAIGERTVLVSIMAANNEIGTLQPLQEIGAIVKEKDVLWHCDGAQALAKIPLDVNALGIDLLSFSGHKIYAPKGIGGLYIRRRGKRVRLQAQLEGGGQEGGWRAGTLNVPGAVGLGAACEIASSEMAQEATRLTALRQQLYQQINAHLVGVCLNGHPVNRLPGCLHLSFAGVDGAKVLIALKDVALSAGAACTSGSNVVSYVLEALGLERDLAFSSLRFGLGRFTTSEEIKYVSDRVIETVKQERV